MGLLLLLNPKRLLSLLRRERLSQLLRLMPKLTLRLTHGCCTVDTMDMDMDIMLHSPTLMLPMSTPMPTPTMDSHMPTTMARDLLMLSQRLMLMLMLGMDTTVTDLMDMLDTTDHTDTGDTMARDLLMLSQRLMLMLMLMLTMDIMDMD